MVVLDPGAALGDGAVEAEIRLLLRVNGDEPFGGVALLLDDRELVEHDASPDRMAADRRIGPRTGARGGAQDTLLERRDAVVPGAELDPAGAEVSLVQARL